MTGMSGTKTRLASAVLAIAVLVTMAPGAGTGAAAVQLPTRLVQSGDLVAQGSFTLPDVKDTTGSYGFEYAQGVIAFNPARNSLFVVGHDWNQQVAEVSIPALGGRAEVLQPFADALAGRITQINPGDPNSKKIGGMTVIGDRLVLAAYSYYDGSGSATSSHFVRPVTLSAAGIQGPFRVGSMNPAFYAGYFAPIPQAWQAALGGTLLNGQCCLGVVSRTSYGPSVSVVSPDDLVAARSPSPAVMLVGYPNGQVPLADWGSTGPLFNGTTIMRGVVLPEGTASVLFFGRHGMGPFCYGDPGPCKDPEDSGKGTHAYPYEPHVWAYSAADLAAVRAGTRQPWDIKPYATWKLSGLSKAGIGGVAYDSTTNRLFVSEQFGDGAKIRIHVFGFRDGGGVVTPPPPPPPAQVVWGPWTAAGQWSACSNGVQTRTESRTTTSGATPPLTETRTVTQACTVQQAGWTLSWSDEFDGTAIDPAKWNVTNSSTSTYGGTAAYYRPQNVVVADGVATLWARRESFSGKSYTSGAITGQGKWTVGPGDFRLEVRADLPTGAGVWPAIWTREGSMPNPDTGVEVDIVELLGHEPTRIYEVQHVWQAGTHLRRPAYCDAWGGDWTTGFHTFTFEREAGTMRWLIDGQVRCTSTQDLPVQPSYLMINISLGGAWPDITSPLTAATPMPQAFAIDYVRVYAKGTVTPPPPPQPKDAVMGPWSEFVSGPWSECANGTQVRTETRTRVVLEPAENGGATGPVTETRQVSQACTVAPPPPPPVVLPVISVSMTTNRCTLVVSADRTPDGTSGWGVQFQRNGQNHGSRDTTAPFSQAASSLTPGSYRITAVWTKAGSASVTQDHGTVVCGQ